MLVLILLTFNLILFWQRCLQTGVVTLLQHKSRKWWKLALPDEKTIDLSGWKWFNLKIFALCRKYDRLNLHFYSICHKNQLHLKSRLSGIRTKVWEQQNSLCHVDSKKKTFKISRRRKKIARMPAHMILFSRGCLQLSHLGISYKRWRKTKTRLKEVRYLERRVTKIDFCFTARQLWQQMQDFRAVDVAGKLQSNLY